MAACPIRGLNEGDYNQLTRYALGIQRNRYAAKMPYSEDYLKTKLKEFYNSALKFFNGNKVSASNITAGFFAAFKHTLDYKDEAGNKPFMKHAVDTDFDFKNWYAHTSFLENALPSERIKFINDYLGLEQQLSLDLLSAMDLEEQNRRDKENELIEAQKSPPPSMSQGITVDELSVNRSKDNFIATPPTPIRSTGLENRPFEDVPDTSDPIKLTYYKVMRELLKKIVSEDMNDSRNVGLQYAPSGVYIRFVSRQKLEKDNMMQHVMNDAASSPYYAVPVNINGDYLYFDKQSGENVQDDKEGVPVFFAVPAVAIDKTSGMFVYDQRPSQLGKSIESYSRRNNKNVEDSRLDVQNLMAMNFAIKEKLLQDPEAKIMGYVNGGSPGYILYDEKIKNMVGDIDFPMGYRLNVDGLNYHGKGKGRTYLYTESIDNYPIEVERPKLSPEIIDKLAILLTADITNSNTGKPISYKLRNELLEQFLYKKPYSSHLIKFLASGVTEADRLNPGFKLILEGIEADLSTVEGQAAAQAKIKQILTNRNIVDYQGKKETVYEAKLNIQNELINANAVDIMDLAENRDGSYTYSENRVDYNTFLERQGIYIKNAKNEQNQLAVLNPYLTFGFSPDQMETFDDKIAIDKSTIEKFKESLELKPEYKGKFIYSTPGTGKTTIISYVKDLVDADDLLANYISKVEGNNEFNEPYSAVTNNTVGLFMESLFNQKPEVATEIYDKVLKDIKGLVKEGKTVLTGSHRYIPETDHVFVQPDDVKLAQALYQKALNKPTWAVTRSILNIKNSQETAIKDTPNKVLILDKQLYDIESDNPVLFNKVQRAEEVKPEAPEVKPGVSELFKSNPELASIGTPEQYSTYLDTVFPDSKVKDLLYHKTSSDEIEGGKFKISRLGGVYFSFFDVPSGGLLKGLIQKLIKENTIIAIVDVKNPFIVNKNNAKEVVKKIGLTTQDVTKLRKNFDLSTNDAVLGFPNESKDTGQLDNFPIISFNEKDRKDIIELAVFEPEQIHILGSKQDIKGFKEFVSKSVPKKDDFGQGPADYVSDPDAFKSIFTKGEEVKATPEQLKAAEDWYKTTPLKEFVPFQIIAAAFNLPSDKVAAWTKGGIILSKRADMSDYYHEAFEGFVRTFMTQDQVRELIRQTRNLPGSFKDYNGIQVSFGMASFEQLVDFLSEGFRNYMLAPESYNFNTKAEKSVFEWLYNILRVLFDGATIDSLSGDPIEATAYIKNLYDKLRVGDLTGYSFQGTIEKKDRVSTGMMAMNDIATKRQLTFRESDLAVKTMDAFISEYIDMYPIVGKIGQAAVDRYLNIRDRRYQGYKKFTQEELDLETRVNRLLLNRRNEDGGFSIGIIKSKEERSKMYGYVYRRLNDKLRMLESDPDMTSLATAQKFRAKADLVKWLIDEYGDATFSENKVPVDEFGNIKGVIAYHMANTEVFEATDKEDILANYNLDEDKIYTESEDGGRNIFGDGGNEVSVLDRASPDLLHILKSLYAMSDDGETPEVNELFVPKMISFDRVWNNMVRLLEGVRDRQDMYKLMVEESLNFPAYNQLLSKIGSPQVNENVQYSMTGFNLWNKVLNTFSNTHIPLIQTTIKETTVDANGNKLVNPKYKVTVGTASAIYKRVGDRWEKEFQDVDPTYAGERVYLKRDAETGRNFIDLDKVLSKFGSLSDKSTPEKMIEFLNVMGISLDSSPSVRAIVKKDVDLRKSIIAFKDKVSKIRDFNKANPMTPMVIDGLTGKNGLVTIERTGLGIASLQTSYNKIQQLEARYSDFHSNFMVTNAELNAQYEHTLNSSLTNILNTLDDFKKYPKFEDIVALPYMNYLDLKRNPQARASVLLNSLFKLDVPETDPTYGSRRIRPATGQPVRVEIHNLSGITLLSDDRYVKGIANASADTQSKLLTELHNFAYLQTMEVMRHSDKKYSYSFGVDYIYANGKTSPFYVPIGEFRADVNTGFRSAANIMAKHLGAELDRVRLFRGLTKGDKANIFYDFDYINRGKDFVLFEDMYDDLKDKLYAIPANVSLKAAMAADSSLAASVMEYLTEYLQRKSSSISERISEAEFIDMPAGFAEEGIDRTALINAFVSNNLIHNLESLSLIYGDPALYNTKKEEFHKRNSGAGGTGTIMATDRAAKMYVNRASFNKDKYAKTVFGSGFKTRDYDGSLDTAVIDDPIVRSAYFDELVKIKTAEIKSNKPGATDEQIREQLFGSKIDSEGNKTIGSEDNVLGGEMKPYNEMKIADAQGYITFDTYRLLRSLAGRWSSTQEKYYNKIVNGEPLDISNAKLAEIFPVEKYQYWGALDLEKRAKELGLPSLISMHKFALVPLVPTVIGNNQTLVQLHNKMMREGVGYALFKSGSKIATASRYNSTTDGNMGDKVYAVDDNNKVQGFRLSEQMTNQAPKFNFVKNTIFIDYLKNQVEIAPNFKEHISFTTQLRKIIQDGLMQNGVPLDFGKGMTASDRLTEWNKIETEAEKERISPNYKRLRDYERNLEDLTKKRQKELMDEMGVELNKDGKIKSGLENFVNFVKRELNRREIGNHAINMLGVNERGEIKVPMDLSLQADEIERMLNNIITKRIIKLQVKGEAFIQVSNGMFEDRTFGFSDNGRNFSRPTDEDLRKYGTIDLPYYRMINVGDKRVVRLAKCKVAMNGDFKLLFNLKDKSGNKIGVWNRVDKEGKISYEFDVRASLDKLNTLLKDDEWLNIGDHRKMVTITGPRIPVQGTNSAEAYEVYEFLPEEAGPIIITPAEIVAKSGSDFDKDTLFMMTPHMYMVNGKVKLKSTAGRTERTQAELTSILRDMRNKREAIYEKYDELERRAEGLKVLKLSEEEQEALKNLKNDYTSAVKDINSQILGLESLWLEVNKGKIRGTEAVRIQNQLYNAYVQKDILRANYESNKSQYLSRKKENYAKFEEKRSRELDKINNEIESVTDELNSNSSGAIENNIINDFTGILSLPENFDALTRPNDTNLVQPLSEIMAPRVSKYKTKDWMFSEKGKKSGKVAGTRIIELEYNLAKHDENNIGKQVLGIAAVDNTYNILYNRIGMHMKHFVSSMDDKQVLELMRKAAEKEDLTADEERALKAIRVQTIRMPHNTFQKNGLDVISLSHTYDVNNQNRIGDVISQLMNGWVDVAKDAWVFHLQGNKEVSPTLMFMVQAGVPFQQAVYFASQPLVREYVRQQRLIKSAYGDAIATINTPAQTNMFRNMARAQVMKNYGFETIGNERAFDMNSVENLFGQKRELMRYSDEYINKVFQKEGVSQFDTTRLFDDTEKDLTQVDDHQRAAFVHFLQLEDMSKASTEFKMATNVDTTRTGSVFGTIDRIIKLRKLEANQRIPAAEMLEKVETASPIASFFIQDFQLQMARELFPIRDAESVINFIIDKANKVSSDVEEIFGENENEDFWNAFRNNIVSFIFQNSLNYFPIESLTSYKGMAIDKEFEIVKAPALYHKVLVSKDKDTGRDVIYIDLKGLEEDFKGDRWKSGLSGKLALRPLLGKDGVEYAKLDPNTFNILDVSNVDERYGLPEDGGGESRGRVITPKETDEEKMNRQSKAKMNQYIKFVIEREILRSNIPLSKAKTYPDYQYLLRDVKKNPNYSSYTQEKKELVAYEEFLKDRALDNIHNAYKMFMQKNVNVAETFRRIYRNHKADLEKYPVMEALTTETMEGMAVKNLRLRNTKLDKNQINVYHENLKELADRGVMKVSDPAANEFISDFFRNLTLYGYIQAGLNYKGRFSLNKVLPTDTFTDFMTSQIKPYAEYLAQGDANLSFFELYYDRFIKAEKVASVRYGGAARYKPYYEPFRLSYIRALDNRKDRKASLVPKVDRPTTKVYEDMWGMYYFKKHPGNLTNPALVATYYADVASKLNEINGKKTVFVHNSFADPDYARNLRMVSDVLISGSGTTNAIGIPTYMNDRMEIQEIKDERDENGRAIPNKRMKELIDNAVANLQKIKDDNQGNVVFIWNNGGYGILKANDKIGPMAKTAPETYIYLTEQLAKFGYANPGAKMYEKSLKNLEEYYQPPMTYEEAAEIYKKCITG